MKHASLFAALFFACTCSSLYAGYVVSIADGRETSGKVSITATSVDVGSEGAAPNEVKFDEILEAEFGDTPFQMKFFSSDRLKGTQFPDNWKAADIGPVDVPGAGTVADGVFTLTGSGNYSVPDKGGRRYFDRCFFAGQQWQGDGQFTVRIKDIDQQTLNTAAGLMIRDTLDDNSIMCTLETTALGGGNFVNREKVEGPARPTPISLTPPAWVRLTRFGNSIFACVSSDYQQWDWIGQADFDELANPWVGIYAHTKREKEAGKSILDQVEFTPSPSSAQIIPPGVILQGGSFLAATCTRMQLDASNPEAPGTFNRSGSTLTIPGSKIASITMLPLTRAQVDALGSGNHLGVVMKNGDAMDGSLDSISKASIMVNSVLLGLTPYERTAVRACVLHQLVRQAAKYDVRLRDGSIIYATSVAANGQTIVFTDQSGVTITTTLDEIAQFRAGPAQVQSLSELDWKATPPKSAPAAAPAAGAAAAPAAGAAPALAPGAAPAEPGPPLVGSWEGPDEEQVLQMDAGTKIDFPINGKFRSISMRVMIDPESPPNAQATFRITANGNDTNTPAIKAGDQPRLIQVTVQDPKTLSISADSPYPGTKVLLIDPVAIKD